MGKTVRKQRLKRGLKDLRKTFSLRTSQAFRSYAERYYKIGMEATSTSDAIVPPRREGEDDAFPLFSWLGDSSSFRKQVVNVCRCSTNELRGAIVDELKVRSGAAGVHPNAVQSWSGKAKELQTRHYMALQGDAFEDLLSKTLEITPKSQ